ncbi:MAG: hypothetical protein K8I02_09930 [Candidatus Methylomirabilis sp.]|nr:hypothetical protein [Deltaproteobacteria bacterium]
MSGPFLSAQTAQAKALALLRIFVGLFWIKAASGKGSEFAAKLPEALEHLATGNPHGWYVRLLQETAIPHVDSLAYSLRIAEWSLGLALTLGVAVGLTGLLGALVSLNAFFAASHLGAAEWGLHALLALVQTLLSFGAAGVTWGLDRALLGRLPAWMIGTPFLGVRVYQRDD